VRHTPHHHRSLQDSWLYCRSVEIVAIVQSPFELPIRVKFAATAN
jgi:hypothetical protein